MVRRVRATSTGRTPFALDEAIGRSRSDTPDRFASLCIFGLAAAIAILSLYGHLSLGPEVLIVPIVQVVIGTAAGGLALWAACWLQKFVRSGIGMPTVGKVAEIAFVIAMAEAAIGRVLNLIGDDSGIFVQAALVSVGIAFLVCAGLVARLLPATFGRAMGLVILQVVMELPIITTLFAVLGLLFTHPAPINPVLCRAHGSHRV